MTICNETQTRLTLNDDVDEHIQQHLKTCTRCQSYAKRSRAFDTVIKSATMPMVPPDLTTQLLALIPGFETHKAVVRSDRWFRQRRFFIGLSVVLSIVSIAVIVWTLYFLGGSQFLQTLSTWPGTVSGWLYAQVPYLETVSAVALALYQPLLWALSLVLLWQVFEYMPQRPQGQSLG